MRTLALAGGIAAIGLTVGLTTVISTTSTSAPAVAVEHTYTDAVTTAYLVEHFTPADCTLFLGDAEWWLEAATQYAHERGESLHSPTAYDFMSQACGIEV